MRRTALICCAALLAAACLHAQSFSTNPCPTEDTGNHWFGGSGHACEVRSATLPLANGRVAVNGMNGSIEVSGENRQDVALEARVSAQAGSRGEAEAILREISINTAGTIEAHGPRNSGQRNWSVSYKLRVPHRLAASLHTENGSLSLTALDGAIEADTDNGSLKLADLAGDVHVSTTNGSITATLDGSTWRGTGLSARTTNGAVSVSIPQPYSAHLVASTVNGGTHLDLPGVDQGGHRKDIDTNLGSGGPTISFETTNGGVSVR
jgi:DUF4097 and DUF4098 domain-containing protein YvlB